MMNVPDNQPIRLGFGEHEWPEREASTAHGRFLFIQAVDNVKPTVRLQLACEPFERYEQLWHTRLLVDRDSAFDLRKLTWPMLDAAGNDVPGTPNEFTPLRNSLKSWSVRWKLTDPWCLDIALETLYSWCRDDQMVEDKPDSEEYSHGDIGHRYWSLAFSPGPADRANDDHQFDFSLHGGGTLNCNLLVSAVHDDHRFDFSHEGWQPTQTRAEAAMIIRRAFEEELRAYLYRIGASAESRGMVRTPERLKAVQHFEWLASYHIERARYSELAKAADVDTDTVRSAVQSRAAEIGLTLRKPDPPGRRPG